MPASDIAKLTAKIIDFRNERDWAQFHNPKDLAAGLAIEAAELQELFLWKDRQEVAQVVSDKRERLAEELADVAWFVLLLAHELGIDIAQAIEAKLALNAAKYPADTVRGSSKKYDEYPDPSV